MEEETEFTNNVIENEELNNENDNNNENIEKELLENDIHKKPFSVYNKFDKKRIENEQKKFYEKRKAFFDKQNEKYAPKSKFEERQKDYIKKKEEKIAKIEQEMYGITKNKKSSEMIHDKNENVNLNDFFDRQEKYKERKTNNLKNIIDAENKRIGIPTKTNIKVNPTNIYDENKKWKEKIDNKIASKRKKELSKYPERKDIGVIIKNYKEKNISDAIQNQINKWVGKNKNVLEKEQDKKILQDVFNRDNNKREVLLEKIDKEKKEDNKKQQEKNKNVKKNDKYTNIQSKLKANKVENDSFYNDC